MKIEEENEEMIEAKSKDLIGNFESADDELTLNYFSSTQSDFVMSATNNFRLFQQHLGSRFG